MHRPIWLRLITRTKKNSMVHTSWQKSFWSAVVFGGLLAFLSTTSSGGVGLFSGTDEIASIDGALIGSFLATAFGGTTKLTTDAPSAGVPLNVNMSKTQDTEAETAVAVDHRNPRWLTTVSNRGAGDGMFHAWSTDGGSTWQRDVIADGDELGFACCDGQLASDDFGNIFLTYLSSSIAVKMAISTDGGATFQALPFLTTLPFGLPVGPWRSLALPGQVVSGDQPSISAAEGSVWISWTSFDGTVQASGAPVTGLGQVGAFTAPQGVSGSNRFGD